MDGFVSTEEAAGRLSVSAQRVRTLLRDGILAGRREGRGWLVVEEDLERYRDEREAAGRRRPGRPVEFASRAVGSAVDVEGAADPGVVAAARLSGPQLVREVEVLRARVADLRRRNGELEERLRRVRLLAELLRTELPAESGRE